MYRYSAKVRLAGSVTNEVLKSNLSPAEVILLRLLHGNDAILQIEEHGTDTAPHEQEREILRNTYARGLSKIRPAVSFESLFGHGHVQLPARLPEFGAKREEDLPPLKAIRTSPNKVNLKDIVS